MKTKNGFRKLLALLLALAMVFTAISVLAEDPVDGEENDEQVEQTEVIEENDEKSVSETRGAKKPKEQDPVDIIGINDSSSEPSTDTDGVEVTATNKDNAIAILADSDDGMVNVTGGDATATVQNGEATGILVELKGNEETTVYVENNVNAVISEGGNGNAIGIDMQVKGNATASIEVGGSVNSDGTGILIEDSSNSRAVTIAVMGDVNGDETGLKIEKSGKSDILIEGTLSGGDDAVELGNNINKQNAKTATTLTVWEIDSGAEGHLDAEGKLAEEENNVKSNANNNQAPTIAENFTNAINFIVKVADGLTNDNVTTKNGSKVTYDEEHNEIIHGAAADGSYDFHTAKADEEVTLSFDLAEGEEFKGIYYNAELGDEVEGNLLTENNGLQKVTNTGSTGAAYSFIITMRNYGYMLLGLSVGQKAPAEEPVEEPGDEEPGEEPGDEEPGDEEPGEEPGDEEPGDEEPGEEPGDEEPGDEEPGEEPGGEEPGDEEPGEEPGDEEPGDEEPGDVPGGEEPAAPAAPAVEAPFAPAAAPVAAAPAAEAAPALAKLAAPADQVIGNEENGAQQGAANANNAFTFIDDYETALAGDAILVIFDTTENAAMAFLPGGTMTLTTSDGVNETGSYRIENRKAIVVNSKGAETSFTNVDGIHYMTYTCGTDGRKWEFEVENKDIDLLIAAQMNRDLNAKED